MVDIDKAQNNYYNGKQNNNIPHNITNFLIVSRFGNEKLTSIRNAIKIFKEYNRKHKQRQI